MAYSASNGAIESLVYQTRIDMISSLKEFLLQNTEIGQESLDGLMTSFKEKAVIMTKTKKDKKASSASGEKKKGAKSPYNEFLGLLMKGQKNSMKEAQAIWKQFKEDNPMKKFQLLLRRRSKSRRRPSKIFSIKN